MRCCHIDLAQTRMEPEKGVRVVGRCNVTLMLVVGPERQSKAVTCVNAGLHVRSERANGTIGFGKETDNLGFEAEVLFPSSRCDPNQNVTGNETHGDAVGVVNDNSVVNLEAELAGK